MVRGSQSSQVCYEVLISYVYSLMTIALVQSAIFHKLF